MVCQAGIEAPTGLFLPKMEEKSKKKGSNDKSEKPNIQHSQT